MEVSEGCEVEGEDEDVDEVGDIKAKLRLDKVDRLDPSIMDRETGMGDRQRRSFPLRCPIRAARLVSSRLNRWGTCMLGQPTRTRWASLA